MSEVANLKLGKLPPRIDARTLKLSSYLSVTALPPLPASTDWTKNVPSWGMLMNDQLGDCAIAGPGHTIMAMTAEAMKKVATVTDEDILAGYEAVGGYRPGDPSTDNGCNMLEVMNYWRQSGIAGHKTAAYISIDVKNKAQVMAGIHLFGGVQFGIQLPQVAQQQFAAGQTWKGPLSPADLRGPWAVGSWGGHEVPGLAYDAEGVSVVTWGKVHKMTWQFIADYADEAYVVVEPDWFSPDGKSPSGFDLYTLWDDLNAITDGRHPIPAPPNRPPVPVGPTPPLPVQPPIVPPAPTPTAGDIIIVLKVDPVSRNVSVAKVSTALPEELSMAVNHIPDAQSSMSTDPKGDLKKAGCPDHLCDEIPATAEKLGISLPQIIGWATTYGPGVWSAFKAFYELLQSQPKPPVIG